MHFGIERVQEELSELAFVCLFVFRANLPDKASEEKANLAKKLAEQRAKGIEVIPTTAKVRPSRSLLNSWMDGLIHLDVIFICSWRSMSLSPTSMRSKIPSLQRTSLVSLWELFLFPKRRKKYWISFNLLCPPLLLRWRWGGGPWHTREPQTSSNGRSAAKRGGGAHARSQFLFYLWTSEQVQWRQLFFSFDLILVLTQ